MVKSFLRKLFLIHSDCELIIDYLKNDLITEGYFYEELVFEHGFKGLLEFVKYSDRIHNSNLLICQSISFKLIVMLIINILVKPRRVVFIIPPSVKHSVKNIVFKIEKYLFKTLTTLMRFINIKQLLVFTTPYERILLENIIRKTRFTYYPTYFAEKPRVSEFVDSEKLTILFFVKEPFELHLVSETISILEEINLKPLVLINYLNKYFFECIDDYRVVCIHQYDYDELIKYSTIIITKTPSPESNSIILKSILYGKPIITSFENGLAIYYRDVDFINIQSSWSSELIVNTILKILSNIDELKKKSLSLNIDILNNSFGKYVIKEFLEE